MLASFRSKWALNGGPDSSSRGFDEAGFTNKLHFPMNKLGRAVWCQGGQICHTNDFLGTRFNIGLTHKLRRCSLVRSFRYLIDNWESGDAKFVLLSESAIYCYVHWWVYMLSRFVTMTTKSLNMLSDRYGSKLAAITWPESLVEPWFKLWCVLVITETTAWLAQNSFAFFFNCLVDKNKRIQHAGGPDRALTETVWLLTLDVWILF